MRAFARGDNGSLLLLRPAGAEAVCQPEGEIALAGWAPGGVFLASDEGVLQRWDWRGEKLSLVIEARDENAAYTAIAVLGEQVWVADRNGWLLRIDGETLAVMERREIALGAVCCGFEGSEITVGKTSEPQSSAVADEGRYVLRESDILFYDQDEKPRQVRVSATQIFSA